MKKAVTLFHIYGFVVFLGSITSFIVVSTVLKLQGPDHALFARLIIEKGTNWLTMPGIWIISITGFYLSSKGLRNQWWVRIKIILTGIILANAYLFILPAANNCLRLAEISISDKTPLGHEFNEAYLKEAMAGSINVILAILASAIGVFKPRLFRKGESS